MRLLDLGAIVCAPMSARGRWLGAIVAERAEDALPLDDAERDVLWILGKTAALASMARVATRQHEKARQLEHRIDLTREVHENVIQRLFGISLALSTDGPLDEADAPALRRRSCSARWSSCARRWSGRSARSAPDTNTTLAEEVRRLQRQHPDLAIEPDRDVELEVPAALEALAQSVLAEAVRNAHKHARPTRVAVSTRASDGTFVLEVSNDGAESKRAPRGRGPAPGRDGGAAGGRRARVRPARARLLAGATGRPVRSGAGVSAPAPRLEPVESGGRPLRVLVVDDHDVVHWGFRQMLGNQTWVERCLSARSGEEAYALALRYEPHVALVDLFIGEESGADVCKQLRKRSPITNVLLISGAGRISAGAAKAAGASGFIPKDWNAADISRAVRMVGLGRDRVPGAGGRRRHAAVAPRARGARADRRRRHQPRGGGRAEPQPAHGQGPDQLAVPQARREEPRGRRQAGRAPGPVGGRLARPGRPGD